MLRMLVFLAFFCSGFTSLVLETLWMRMLVLIFGGTTLAIVTILTAFMGGLALGSAIASRFSHRIHRPLRVYGWLEFGVALYAALSPWWIKKLPLLYQWVPMDWPFAALISIRFLLCVLLLLIPTALMGATLPVLSQYIARHRAQIGFDVGLLYSVNTWGAVAGTLIGGFVLLPLFGHLHTLWSAAGLLFLVALGMLWLGQQRGDHPEPEMPGSADDPTTQSLASFRRPSTPEQRRLAIWCIALTGAMAMVCQVVWSRALAMVIGSSTYAFTLILGLFLLGLALGAAWGAWLVKRSLNIATSWSTLLLATGCAIGVGNLVIDRLPLLFLWLIYDSVGKISIAQTFALKAAVTALPLLLPTLLMGTFFPLALAVYANQDDAASASVGRLYAANTLGSISGSVLTGFVLIPILGLQGSLALCVCLYCLSALLLVRTTKRPTQIDNADDTSDSDDFDDILMGTSNNKRRATTFVALVVGVGIWWAPTWHPGLLSLGMFRLSLMNAYTYETAKTPGHVLFYREGISATVTVQGGPVHRGLKVNGKADASSISDSGTQVASGVLPLLLHPNPKDVVVIGWGSGMTAGAVLHFPIKKLTAIELEPAVVEAAKLFRKWNFHPEKDPRLTLYYNDGRNFLARTKKRFDVISSEPSNPWMAGTANLFTTEFFQLARSRLRPGGLHCQFIQLYELSYDNILTLLRSAREVFPYVRLFIAEPDSYDTLLVASMHPIKLDLNELARRIKPPKYKELWRRIKLESVFGWLPRMVMGEKEIDELLKRKQVPLNRDNHNIIEFRAPFDLVRQSRSKAAVSFHAQVKSYGMRFRRYFRWNGRSLAEPQSGDVWIKACRAFLRYGKIKQAKQIHALAKQAGAPKETLKHYKRLIRMMRSKEKAPPLPQLRSVPKKERKLVRQLYRARELFFKDEETHSIWLLKKILKNKAFVEKYPIVWFYLAANSRHTNVFGDAFKYYERFIHKTKTKTPQKETRATSRPTTQPKTSATSQPASLPTTRPTNPASRPASQPAR